MKQYLAVIEKTATGWGAYVPDLPGVIAASESYAETKQRIEGAIEIWLDETRADGLPVPEPTAQGILVESA